MQEETDLEELTKLKEQLETKKHLMQQLEGKRSVALEELQKELGTNNIKHAKREQIKIQEYIGKLENEFQLSIKRFKESYPQLIEEDS